MMGSLARRGTSRTSSPAPVSDGHEHDSHAGHTHEVSADAVARKLGIALSLILRFMGFELVVGLVAHSLALLSDAAHMLTDGAPIGLPLAAPHAPQRGS